MSQAPATVVRTADDLATVRRAVRHAIEAGVAIGFDVETVGPYIDLEPLKPGRRHRRKPDALRHRVVGYAVTVGGLGWYVNLRGPDAPTGDLATACHRLLRFTAHPKARVVAHNWSFEYQVLANEGITARCIMLDSMLAAWHRGMRLDGGGGLKLKPLMEHNFNRRRPDFDAVMRGRAVDAVPAGEVAPYCIADARDAVQLWQWCWAAMSEEERTDYLEVEAPTIRVASHMMHTGVPLDAELLERTAVDAQARMRRLRAEFTELTTTEVEVDATHDPATGERFREPKACPACDCRRRMPEHTESGNCGSDSVMLGCAECGRGNICDVCHLHDEPRGECSECPPCPACAEGGSAVREGGATCATPGCVAGVLHYKNGKPRMVATTRRVRVRRGADIGSSQQVSRWLWDELGWWPDRRHPRTKDGHRSTKGDHIKPFIGLPGNAGLAARMRLEYQALTKYAESYTRGLVAIAGQYHDRRLHTSYLQTGTNTGRFSSSGPNISNVPTPGKAAVYDLPAVRGAFVAPPGWVCVIRDISQAELRILAYLSQDPVLLAVYRDGGDVHGELQAELGIERIPAKTTNFSCVYRIGPRSLAVKLTAATGTHYTPRKAGQFIDGFHARFRRVARYHERAIAAAEARGYARSLGGFRMPLPAEEWRARRHYTENRAINYPIQGTVGTIIKRVMVALYDKWQREGVLGGLGGRPDGRVVLQQQTYDEVGVLARADFAEQANEDMRAVMEDPRIAAPLDVPLVSSGGIGPSWADAK